MLNFEKKKHFKNLSFFLLLNKTRWSFYGDMLAHGCFHHIFLVVEPEKEILNWIQLFKTNDVVS